MDKALKKKVIEDWHNAFPQLSMYAQDKLYKVVGPLIIGLELIKLPRTDEYRPHFVMYSLFGNKMGTNIKACLAGPFLLKEYNNKKGFQYSIPYQKHEDFFNEVLQSVKQQTPFSLEGDVSYDDVVKAIDKHSKTEPLSASPNSYLQAVLQEVKLKIALFIGEKEAESVLQQIIERSWDENSFSMWKVDLNKWVADLRSIILKRNDLLIIVKENQQDKKISTLYKANLVP
jgi:hypothetical protein